MAEKVVFVSVDGERVEMSVLGAKMSRVVCHLLEDVGSGEEKSVEIPVDSASGKELRKVAEWCEYHAEHPEGGSVFVKGGKVDSFGEFDAKFVEGLRAEDETFFFLVKTLLAANFLDIPGLVEILCRAIAALIKGRSKQEICDMFRINPDPTPEQLDEVYKLYPWLSKL